MLRTIAIALSVPALAGALAASTQAPAIDREVNARIRDEGIARSQIMETLHQLTDVYGPRLTGSPNQHAAAEWAVGQMERWGLTNGRLVPWDFARDGWSNDEAAGQIVSPVKDNLVFEVLAWTPSTNGVVTAPALSLVVPQGPLVSASAGPDGARFGPTAAELDAYLAELAPRVRGAIVLVGRPLQLPFQETAPPTRRADAQLQRMMETPPATSAQGPARQGGSGRGGRGSASSGPDARLTAAEVATRLNQFLLDERAAVRVNDAGRRHGQIRAFSFSGYDVTKTVPTVVLRNEDFGRIFRILADRTAVTLRFNIVNRTHPEGRTSHNAFADIPGTDKADELVMLGGHLDSWHAATGATDNAAGCAVIMEAARILKTIGVRPRRTIRVALWSGEEQGLLGSRAFVASEFGTAEQPKPTHARLSAYFNLDSGTGRIRLASVFGPPQAAAIISDYLSEFKDFGAVGAVSTISRTGGGTDSAAFNIAGLPGINFLQDPIEYDSHTWHSNLDTLERIVEDDVKKAAIVVASLVYHTAMREDMLPRTGATGTQGTTGTTGARNALALVNLFSGSGTHAR